jgi:putative tryptophan/tyrosine transport system substrate-binding protein
MRRRDFIAALGGAAAWPMVARAQQPERMRRIGALIVFAENDPEQRARNTAFLNRLEELGWKDGRNLRIDYRFSEGDPERMLAHARELVALSPDLILVQANTALTALRQTTSTVPCVFVQVSDPVGSGFVKSLAHPGGNLTGFTNFEPEMGGKWLEVLKENAPDIVRVAVLLDADLSVHSAYLRAAETAGRRFGTAVIAAEVRNVADIEQAVTALAAEPRSSLIVLPHPIHVVHRDQIIALAARHRLPSIYPLRLFANAGGLMSYGIDQIDQWLRAASYVDRILKGAKPADLPVQQPIKYQLVINSRPRRRSALPFHRRCSPAPTR